MYITPLHLRNIITYIETYFKPWYLKLNNLIIAMKISPDFFENPKPLKSCQWNTYPSKKLLLVWLYQVLAMARSSIFTVACTIFSCSTWNLVPWPEIKSGTPALVAQSLSHWTSMEVLKYIYLKTVFCTCSVDENVVWIIISRSLYCVKNKN